MKNKPWFPCLLLLLLVNIFLLTGAVPAGSNAFLTPPGYLKSVTYFSDDWVMNFWNSESRDMDAELQRIADDGFNSIILAIPWREFQPNLEKPSFYNDYAMNKFDRVMSAAASHGLWVSVRLGYTWDYYDVNESTLPRYESLLSDTKTMQAWKEYAKTIYKRADAHENFYGGFITWEDFWNFTDQALGMGNTDDSVKKAAKCGYSAYVKKHYTLSQLSGLYGEEIQSYGELYLPKKAQPAAKVFYEFYDDFLNRILKETQTVFPGLSLEVRLDRELLYDEEGKGYYYGHESTFPCDGAAYTATMTSIAMGQANKYEKIDAYAGITKLSDYLAEVVGKTGGKRLYIEQFLYMDNTPEFAHNAQIKAEMLNDYLIGMIPVLRNYSMGYGIWVYQNYGNNQLYNSQFALGTAGWNLDKGIKIRNHENTPMAMLPPNQRLRQELKGDLNAKRSDIHLRFRACSDTPVSLDIYFGMNKKTVEVSGDQEYQLEFKNITATDISFISSGTVYIDDVNVYGMEQEGRLYDMNGQALDCIPSIRRINAELQ